MATITRKTIAHGDKSYMLQIKYSATDARQALQQFIREHPTMAKSPMSKQLVKEIFFKHPLGYLPRRNAEPLAEFLFLQSVKNDLIVVVPKIWADDEPEYIVSPSIGDKRPGPKTKQKEQ